MYVGYCCSVCPCYGDFGTRDEGVGWVLGGSCGMGGMGGWLGGVGG